MSPSFWLLVASRSSLVADGSKLTSDQRLATSDRLIGSLRTAHARHVAARLPGWRPCLTGPTGGPWARSGLWLALMAREERPTNAILGVASQVEALRAQINRLAAFDAP